MDIQMRLMHVTHETNAFLVLHRLCNMFVLVRLLSDYSLVHNIWSTCSYQLRQPVSLHDD
jgi:hypothetical protein